MSQGSVSDGGKRKTQVLFGLGLLLALTPALWLAWHARDLPHLGYFSDDGIYVGGALSLARGDGYRIPSLPGTPNQTKFPPLYSLLLAAARLATPAGIPDGAPFLAVNLLLLAALVFCSWRYFLQQKLSARQSWAAAAVLAVAPGAGFLSISLLSEILFCALVTACLLLAGEKRLTPASALTAGCLGGFAYFTRSAALPLAAALPLYFLLRRERRSAVLFFAGMAPFVAAWTLWRHFARSTVAGPAAVWYTDYPAVIRENVSLATLPNIVWVNLATFLKTAGNLLIYSADAGTLEIQLLRLVGVAAVFGAWRLARRNGLTPFHWFGICYLAQLLVWCYTPNERLVLPLLPLLLAGLFVEVSHAARLVKQTWQRPARDQKAAAALLSSFAVAVALLAVVRAGRAYGWDFPEMLARCRQERVQKQPAYDWIARRLPPDAVFMAHDDSGLYFATGRRAYGFHFPPRLYYQGDRAAIVGYFSNATGLARQNGAQYYLWTPWDFQLDLSVEERREAFRRIQADLRLERVFQSPDTTLYRIAD